MATSEKRQKLFGGFNRLRDFPLDASSLYETKDEAEAYLRSNKTAYEGQLIVVKHGEGQGIYKIGTTQDETLTLGDPLADSSDVAQAFEDIAEIKGSLADHDSRITQTLEWLTSVSKNYATKGELDAEIRKLLGDDYANIKTELNSIYELSEQLDRVLVLLYEGLNGRTYSDVVSAVLTNLSEIKALSKRLDDTASAINARIDGHDERLTVLEAFKAHMTDQHILDVVNSQGLEHIEYKEAFHASKEARLGSFTYTPGFIITKASIIIDNVAFDSQDTSATYSVGLRLEGSQTLLAGPYELPVDETAAELDFPLINAVPSANGKAELVLSENIAAIAALVAISYTRVPNN